MLLRDEASGNFSLKCDCCGDCLPFKGEDFSEVLRVAVSTFRWKPISTPPLWAIGMQHKDDVCNKCY